jgi:hypothetical protein
MADTKKISYSEKRKLTTEDMVKGNGKKATDEELMEYLLEDKGEPINIKKHLPNI